MNSCQLGNLEKKDLPAVPESDAAIHELSETAHADR